MTDVLDRLELLNRLTDRIEAFKTTEGWRDWLAVAARFRTYSLNNQLLILMQRPDASQVAGYQAWRSLGRQVKRGETSIRIFAPLIKKASDADDTGAGRVLVGFRTVAVFDLSQTEGEPLPGSALPTVTVPDDQLFQRFTTAAERTQIGVDLIANAPEGVRGWWQPDGRTITISDRETVANRTRTMLHELAHAIDIPTSDVFAERGSRPVRELVAESAAYIVGTGVFGIDMDDASSHYAASWGADRDQLHDLAHRVLDVAHALEHMLSDCLGKPV